MGINTLQELVAYLRNDCYVYLSEGFFASQQVALSDGNNIVAAAISDIDKHSLNSGEIGVSELSKVAFRHVGKSK